MPLLLSLGTCLSVCAPHQCCPVQSVTGARSERCCVCVRVEEEGCEAPVALREAPVALREEVAQRPENDMRVCVCACV